ncbi:MAG: hypothetical protein SAL07_22705 [Oscillatoria sp. PMC 1051.18]|nr:hypothetical protein [Oscillatoria sp. PMC 1050.18]MEC5032721.1 hypothetical protein [Oscillatoria sp. PMC 1051.18]
MIRTVISFEPDDKSWLDKKAKEQQTTLAALVRQAVKQMRQQDEAESPSFETLLETTRGIWQGKDGLDYQQAIRDEW